MVLGAVPTLVENSFLQVDIRWDMTLPDLLAKKDIHISKGFPSKSVFLGIPLVVLGSDAGREEEAGHRLQRRHAHRGPC